MGARWALKRSESKIHPIFITFLRVLMSFKASIASKFEFFLDSDTLATPTSLPVQFSSFLQLNRVPIDGNNRIYVMSISFKCEEQKNNREKKFSPADGGVWGNFNEIMRLIRSGMQWCSGMAFDSQFVHFFGFFSVYRPLLEDFSSYLLHFV